MKMCVFSRSWNLKYWALNGILVYIFHLFLHNLGVLKSSLSNDILYLVTFTFKLAKHKMAVKMLITPRIFYGLSQMKAQCMVSVRFLFKKFIASVFGKKWPLFDLQIQYVRRF